MTSTRTYLLRVQELSGIAVVHRLHTDDDREVLQFAAEQNYFLTEHDLLHLHRQRGDFPQETIEQGRRSDVDQGHHMPQEQEPQKLRDLETFPLASGGHPKEKEQNPLGIDLTDHAHLSDDLCLHHDLATDQDPAHHPVGTTAGQTMQMRAGAGGLLLHEPQDLDQAYLRGDLLPQRTLIEPV